MLLDEYISFLIFLKYLDGYVKEDECY